MSDAEMHLWTGRTYDEFEAILEQTPSLSETCNQPKTALGIYLTKLRTGDSDERLATLFNISRRKLERSVPLVRECLSNDYVVLHCYNTCHHTGNTRNTPTHNLKFEIS